MIAKRKERKYRPERRSTRALLADVFSYAEELTESHVCDGGGEPLHTAVEMDKIRRTIAVAKERLSPKRALDIGGPNVLLEVVRGPGGLAIYVNGLRVRGGKPWGGGPVIIRRWIAADDMLDGLASRCPAENERREVG